MNDRIYKTLELLVERLGTIRWRTTDFSVMTNGWEAL